MNDQVNKVIASILNAEQLEGGARRRKKHAATHHAGGIFGNIKHNVAGGETSESGLSGGACAAQSFTAPATLYAGRYIAGGSTEVSAESTQVAASTNASAEVGLTGGRSKKRSKSRSKKRTLNPAMKRWNMKVKGIYNDLLKKYPNVPKNELLTKAMKMAKRSK